MQCFIANISSRVISVRASSATSFSYISTSEHPTPGLIYILRFFYTRVISKKKKIKIKKVEPIVREMKILKLVLEDLVSYSYYFFLN